jgi:hypothetical protein
MLWLAGQRSIVFGSLIERAIVDRWREGDGHKAREHPGYGVPLSEVKILDCWWFTRAQLARWWMGFPQGFRTADSLRASGRP